MNKLEHRIGNEWAALQENHLCRYPKVFDCGQEPVAIVDGREVLVFSSSNYLSLSDHSDVVNAASQAIKKYGLGSGGSRLTTGTYQLQIDLEQALADIIGYPGTCLMTSGYHVNIGVIGAIANQDTHIFSDEKNHASLIDGCRLSRGKIHVYPHLDMKVLEQQLAAHMDVEKLIVTDGVFSMDGDIAPLPELSHVAKKYGATWVVDDAHGFGVLGKHGSGILEYFGKRYRPDLYIGTLSKAAGGVGGFVAAEERWLNYLRNTARSYIFSTSLPPGVVGGVLMALETMPKAVQKLHENIRYMNLLLRETGIIKETIHTSIFPIAIGEEERAVRVAEEIWKQGVLMSCIRYPAVPRGKAILRMTVMAGHTREQLAFAVEVIQNAIAIIK